MEGFMDPATQQVLWEGVKPHLTGIAVTGVLSGAINLIARWPVDARRKARRHSCFFRHHAHSTGREAMFVRCVAVVVRLSLAPTHHAVLSPRFTTASLGTSPWRYTLHTARHPSK
jgi:hypothetical protein